MLDCFQLLRTAGATYFALFGGAVRDADYAKRHNEIRTIKDYDLRVWLDPTAYEENLQHFIKNLVSQAKTAMTEVSSPGTDKIRYCLNYKNIELDISVRPIPAEFKEIPLSAVAIDRANDSDIGISAVAIDPNGQAWAKMEYGIDQVMKTLTVYPHTNLKRLGEYVDRIKKKFPNHVLTDG